MIQVNCMGDVCPVPVVKTKNAIKAMTASDTVEVLVDNEISVQNLMKMANYEGYAVRSEKLGEKEYKVTIDAVIKDAAEEKAGTETGTAGRAEGASTPSESAGVSEGAEASGNDTVVCMPDRRGNKVVVISSNTMGHGNDELGGVLIKGFIYAISQQDELPATMLFYNGGAKLTCEDSASMEDLKSLEAAGVEILTCGTCLNYYGLTEKLAVGEVTNMYVIAEKMTKAGLIIKP